MDGDGGRRGAQPVVVEGAAAAAGASRRSLQPLRAQRAQGGFGVVRADPVLAGAGALVLRGQLRRAQPLPQVTLLQGLHYAHVQ